MIIAYNNFEGEQTVNLTGEVKEFDLNIQVKERSVFRNPQVIGVIGVMGMTVVVLTIILIKIKKTNKSSLESKIN